MKKWMWVGLGTLVVLLAGAAVWTAVADHDDDAKSASAKPAASGAPASTGSGSADKPNWLFSTNADGGTLTQQSDGSSVLTLTGVDRRVTAFTDRPDRDAATIPVAVLIDAWPKIFEASAPNAVLAAEDANGDSTSVVVTLTDPKLDGTTATFTAKVVKSRSRLPELAALVQSKPSTPPATFGAANLFIDDVSAVLSCSNPHTLKTIYPPGLLPPGSDSADEQAFKQECAAAGGQLMIVDLP